MVSLQMWLAHLLLLRNNGEIIRLKQLSVICSAGSLEITLTVMKTGR